MARPTPDPSRDRLDPVYRHARREAVVILAAWLACFVWCVTYCYTHGYGLAADEVATTWGVPSWVFYGVAAPWALASTFTVVFSLFVMADDDLNGEGAPDDRACESSQPPGGGGGR